MKEIEGEWLDKEQAYEKYKRLIAMAVHKKVGQAKNFGMDYDDVYNVAVIGFLKAYENYDPERGAAFSTHVYNSAYFSILRAIRDTNLYMYVPSRIKETIPKIKKINNYEELKVEELAEIVEFDESVVRSALEILNHTYKSLNAPMQEGDAKVEFMDLVGESNDESELYVEDFISKLHPRYQKIIRLRLAGKSQKYIATEVGLSQTYVGDIIRQNIALSWMRYAEV